MELAEETISRDPEVLQGTPVFRGTRVPTATLIDYLEDGETLETFLRNFPGVTRAQAEVLLEHLRATAAPNSLMRSCA
ncbi:MAG: DUF433 domain-containing protein [Acidobacteria bacterium]|nr:DUF433 domain-containing protein [Acidobacteriota bacterium]